MVPRTSDREILLRIKDKVRKLRVRNVRASLMRNSANAAFLLRKNMLRVNRMILLRMKG